MGGVKCSKNRRSEFSCAACGLFVSMIDIRRIYKCMLLCDGVLNMETESRIRERPINSITVFAFYLPLGVKTKLWYCSVLRWQLLLPRRSNGNLKGACFLFLQLKMPALPFLFRVSRRGLVIVAASHIWLLLLCTGTGSLCLCVPNAWLWLANYQIK